MSPLFPLVQPPTLSAAVAAITREAHVTSSLLSSRLGVQRTRLMDQVRITSNDFLPAVSLLESRLERLGASQGSELGGEVEVSLGLLDHVSRQTSALATALRFISSDSTSSYLPDPFSTISPAAAAAAASLAVTTPITLDQLLVEGGRGRSPLFPAPAFLPNPWI